MKRMVTSVRILIADVEKYVTSRLLQPCGNVGDHACAILPLHSNICYGESNANL